MLNEVELSEKVKSLFRAKVKALMNHDIYSNPQPQYMHMFFDSVCHAFVINTSGKMNILTVDKATTEALIPSPTTYQGLLMPPAAYSETLYNRLRTQTLSMFGKTLHDPWPPRKGNSGEMLKALCEAYAEGIYDIYKRKADLIITHALQHPLETKVESIVFINSSTPNIMKSMIIGASPLLKGQFWPVFVENMVDEFCLQLTKKSTFYKKEDGASPSLTMPATGILK
jgi:hypothetical protein